MKKYIKKVSILLLISLFIFAIFSQVFAVSGSEITSSFGGSSGSDLQGSNEITNLFAGILDAVRIATAAIAIIMLTVLAIKYMVSSPNDRAEIKKGATVYVIGAVVMMGASFLVTIIRDFADNSIKVE